MGNVDNVGKGGRSDAKTGTETDPRLTALPTPTAGNRGKGRGRGGGSSEGEPMAAGAARAERAQQQARDEPTASDAVEHLTRDLARVRAKFGMDPVLAPISLAAAWTTETVMEEDEAEFVDAVADCLGAGLSLEDALNCWDTGDLVYDAVEGRAAADTNWMDLTDAADSDADDDGERIILVERPARQPSGGHRVFVR